MDTTHLSAILKLCPYPDEAAHIDQGIRGAGFYPGTRGFLASPIGGVLLLGQDFGTLAYYLRLSGTPARD